jgi:hypothetical protein
MFLLDGALDSTLPEYSFFLDTIRRLFNTMVGLGPHRLPLLGRLGWIGLGPDLLSVWQRLPWSRLPLWFGRSWSPSRLLRFPDSRALFAEFRGKRFTLL